MLHLTQVQFEIPLTMTKLFIFALSIHSFILLGINKLLCMVSIDTVPYVKYLTHTPRTQHRR